MRQCTYTHSTDLGPLSLTGPELSLLSAADLREFGDFLRLVLKRVDRLAIQRESVIQAVPEEVVLH